MNTTTTNPLFIGMNPSKKPRCKSLERLFRWFDAVGVQYAAFTNLSADPKWDLQFDTFDHEFVRSQTQGHDKIVALGLVVSKHLTKLGIDHYRIPHPSPLNRLLNDKRYTDDMLQRLDAFLDVHHSPSVI